MKIKAGILFYSIIISLTMAIISGSVILLYGLSSRSFQHAVNYQELEQNAASGLNLLLSNQEMVRAEETITMDLFGNGNDSVMLSRQFWGAYEIIMVKAMRKGRTVNRIAETGDAPDTLKNYALYVCDHDHPISVSGHTKITGRVFFPKAGVTRASIDGQSYSGSRLIYGEIKESEKTIPPFNKQLIQRINNILLQAVSSNEKNIALSLPLISNGFSDSMLLISSTSPVNINQTISGHVLITSRKSITIETGANLIDVIFAAPKIILKKGTHGNFQAFASDSIIVEENVTLSYPSVLGIVHNEKMTGATALLLSKNDTITGSLFSYCNAAFSTLENGIVISPGAVVYGSIYSTGFADAEGYVAGSILCDRLRLNANASVYENQLLNTIVDRSALTADFVDIQLQQQASQKKVIQWLR